MQNVKRIVTIILLLNWIIVFPLFAEDQKEIEKSFSKKDKVRIKLILGDCYLNNSNDDKIHIHVVHSYYEDNFEVRFREKGNSLIIEEKLHGRNSDGNSTWTIAIPKDIEIDFESATGDLILNKVILEIEGNTGTGNIEAEKVKGSIELSTGTGDIEVINSEGELELNSGTGNVRIEESKGNFDANSGTGNVEAKNITIEDEAELNSGTGDVEVINPQGTNFDLSINSGTDEAVLDMHGSPIQGYFEFTAHLRKGRIVCPIEFDEEEEYYNGDGKYVRRSFTKGKNTSRYFINTGTGKAKLIQ
jgi:hypothetical protein